MRRLTPQEFMNWSTKFIRLAAKANPTVLEIFYLDDYTIITPVGQMLIDHRATFLSKTIYASYGGYAIAQARRLNYRGDSFSSDTKHRYSKHARHCFRLLQQGRQLLVLQRHFDVRTGLLPANGSLVGRERTRLGTEEQDKCRCSIRDWHAGREGSEPRRVICYRGAICVRVVAGWLIRRSSTMAHAACRYV